MTRRGVFRAAAPMLAPVLALTLALTVAAREGRAEPRALKCSAGGVEDTAFSQIFDIDVDKWVVRRRATGFPAYGPVPGRVTGTTMDWQDPTGGPAMSLDTKSLKMSAAGAAVWTCKPYAGGN